MARSENSIRIHVHCTHNTIIVSCVIVTSSSERLHGGLSAVYAIYCYVYNAKITCTRPRLVFYYNGCTPPTIVRILIEQTIMTRRKQ